MSFEDVRDALRLRFPPEQIGTLPASRGRPALDFVGHAAVTDRLNRVCGSDWYYTVDEVLTINGACWIRGTMVVAGVARPEYGDGKDPKEAIGNFIRRGAMRFGVGIDLWSREELEATPESVAVTDTGGVSGRGTTRESSPPASGAGAPHREEWIEPPSSEAHGAPLSSGAPGPEAVREPENAADTYGEGVRQDSKVPARIAGPDDWAVAARNLKTSRPQAQQQVMTFLKTARNPARSVQEVDVDTLNWAVGSITLGRRTA